MAGLSNSPRHGEVPCKRKNLPPPPMVTVPVFCPLTTCGSGLVTGVQTTGACKLVALSKLTFHGFIGQAIVKLPPAREKLSDNWSCKRKNRLPGPMGTVTVICPPTSAGTASVTGVQTVGGCKFVVLTKI